MSALVGSLGLLDSERDFINDVGHALVFEHINAVLDMYNEEISGLFDVFVDRDITQDTLRFLKPITGMSAQLSEFAPAAGVGRIGSWDCAFPIRGWGNALDISRWAEGYMTVQVLGTHLDGLMQRDLARTRRRILTAIFEDTNLTWLDETQDNASLTIRRLANTDGTTFPPVLGSDTEAQDDHYSETDYTIASISDANNPLSVLRDEIVEHFGGRSARGEDLVVFMNTDAEAYIEALTGFIGPGDERINYGDDTDLSQLLSGLPGRIIGRHSGVWCSVYAWIPATYMVAVHLDYPPLMKRIDPAYTGLGKGYHLVAKDMDHPLTSSQFEHRYGYAVANRLSAAVIEISGEDGTYEPPSDYSE